MDKSKNFETSVPDGYVLVKCVDAKSDKKIMVVYSILSFVPVIVLFPLICLALSRLCGGNLLNEYLDHSILLVLLFSVIYLLYIVLHELTHGITYKICTGGKLTFGLTTTVAFCGVPNLYVKRKASILALIMPFAVFTIVFLALTVALYFVSPAYSALMGLILTFHLGGCVGDLHWTMMYLTTYRGLNTLMRDTGPTQWLYVPKSEALERNLPIIENTPND